MPETLVEAVARATEGPQEHIAVPTAVAGLTLMRSNQERLPNTVIYRPALCIVVQGRKRTAFGETPFDCGPGEAVFVGTAALGVGQVVEASPAEPYLGIVLEIDMATLREVLEEVETPTVPDEAMPQGIFSVYFDSALYDCVRRLVQLLDTPKAIPLLAPGIMREVCYWLLTGPQAAQVCQVASLNGPTKAVIDALHQLRERFTEPLRVGELARTANMSPSAFHLRFKALTATSPLQYQKQLRLHEARRLLREGEATVEAAAFQVGYVSPSQFSREYSRTFGLSPKRDATRLAFSG